MLKDARRSRPPELVAATDSEVILEGEPVTVRLQVDDARSEADLEVAQGARGSRVLLNVEDLRAERNPGVVYGVYLHSAGAPSDAPPRVHVGNLAPFGIEHLSEGTHRGAPGFRHTFDVTDEVEGLVERHGAGLEDLAVTFDVIAPEPPPGEDADVAAMKQEAVAAERRAAAATPLRVGRVSFFVARELPSEQVG